MGECKCCDHNCHCSNGGSCTSCDCKNCDCENCDCESKQKSKEKKEATKYVYFDPDFTITVH